MRSAKMVFCRIISQLSRTGFRALTGSWDSLSVGTISGCYKQAVNAVTRSLIKTVCLPGCLHQEHIPLGLRPNTWWRGQKVLLIDHFSPVGLTFPWLRKALKAIFGLCSPSRLETELTMLGWCACTWGGPEGEGSVWHPSFYSVHWGAQMIIRVILSSVFKGCGTDYRTRWETKATASLKVQSTTNKRECKFSDVL